LEADKAAVTEDGRARQWRGRGPSHGVLGKEKNGFGGMKNGCGPESWRGGRGDPGVWTTSVKKRAGGGNIWDKI